MRYRGSVCVWLIFGKSSVEVGCWEIWYYLSQNETLSLTLGYCLALLLVKVPLKCTVCACSDTVGSRQNVELQLVFATQVSNVVLNSNWLV